MAGQPQRMSGAAIFANLIHHPSRSEDPCVHSVDVNEDHNSLSIKFCGGQRHYRYWCSQILKVKAVVLSSLIWVSLCHGIFEISFVL